MGAQPASCMINRCWRMDARRQPGRHQHAGHARRRVLRADDAPDRDRHFADLLCPARCRSVLLGLCGSLIRAVAATARRGERPPAPSAAHGAGAKIGPGYAPGPSRVDSTAYDCSRHTDVRAASRSRQRSAQPPPPAHGTHTRAVTVPSIP